MLFPGCRFWVGFVGRQEYIKAYVNDFYLQRVGRMFWKIVCFAKLPVERSILGLFMMMEN